MSKFYFELNVKPSSHYDIFLDLVNSLSTEAIQEYEGGFILRSVEDLSDIKEGIEKFSQSLNISCIIEYEKKENIDWIEKYQKSVKPLCIGNFYIRPSWEEKKDDKIDIIIDPSLSFGSGHHETTNACIEAIDKYVKQNDELLDVGCGSGVLSISAAKKGAIVDICDTDKVCLSDTASNFSLNNVSYNKSWLGSVSKATKQYDIVLANIVADVLIMLSKDLKKQVKPDGLLIISGILDKYLDKVLAKFKDLKQVELIHKNEWISIIFKKEF